MGHRKSSNMTGKSMRKRSVNKARPAMGLMASTSLPNAVVRRKLRSSHVVEERERVHLTHADMAKIEEICAKPVELSPHLLEAIANRSKYV